MPSTTPNFIFILADDLGWGDVGCFGRPDYATPGIDALASSGMKLTQAYANSSTCSPTRIALITGRYQNRIPAGLYDPIPAGLKIGLPPDHPTLPRLLGAAGYETALIGKWHMGMLPDYGPLRSGYDEFFGVMHGEMDYFAHKSGGLYDASKSVNSLYEGESPVEEDGYMTEMLTQRAVEYIKRERQKPFFLSLHYTAPHWPWEGPNDRKISQELDHHLHFDGGSMDTFAEMVACLDVGVATVRQAVRERGIEHDTIVIFSSDNGGERWSYNWPFRSEKGYLWEGGIRVPTLISWPGRIAAGAVSTQLAMSMDWMPTLLALAGGTPDPSYPSDGKDLSQVLLGRTPEFDRHVFWRTQEMGAARSGRWKYVIDTNGYEYLFDIASDMRENANLKKREPAVFNALRQSFESWGVQMLRIPPEHHRPPIDEAIAKGRALMLTRD